MFPTISPDSSSIPESRTWILMAHIGIFCCRQRTTLSTKIYHCWIEKTVAWCCQDRLSACLWALHTMDGNIIFWDCHQALASWEWQGFSLKNLDAFYPKAQLTRYRIALASSLLTIILHNHTPNCCCKQFLVMDTASLGFTGKQKLLSFLKLQNTGNVSIWLPIAKRLHKYDIKKKKKRELQTTKISEILKILCRKFST